MNSAKSEKEIKKIVMELKTHPAVFNQSLIELSALHCKLQNYVSHFALLIIFAKLIKIIHNYISFLK